MALDLPSPEEQLLRFSTAGSVDDGKSTLIGRLLFETRQIVDDQLEAIERASLQQGSDYLNLALLTDGLRAEREQGITIDVAYRYFATSKRKFIIADTPGHAQYTRNMVTGASTADLALVLVDARRGIQEQSRRHALIASLLRVPHLLICINKMDLVDYSQDAFEDVRREFVRFAEQLDVPEVVFIPISALRGDNVVERSANMPWYTGPALLSYLESLPVDAGLRRLDARFPVQWIVRPRSDDHHDYRGYAGQLASGCLRVGDAVVVCPSGLSTRISAIDTFDGPVDEAAAPMSVTLRLEDHIDVSRGDLICPADAQPQVGQDVQALVCWMDAAPLRPGGRYAIKHTTRSARALVKELSYRLDVNTLKQDETASLLELNDIGRVAIRTTQPLCYDPYKVNRVTGSFILIDEADNRTVGAGMIE